MAILTGQTDDEVIGQINTTPLVDVMLVLLIIFLITVPVVSNSIRLSLPETDNTVKEASHETVTLSVDASGRVYYAGRALASTAELVNQVLATEKENPQTTFELQGDRDARFAPVGRVLYALQKVGVARVELVVQPPR